MSAEDEKSRVAEVTKCEAGPDDLAAHADDVQRRRRFQVRRRKVADPSPDQPTRERIRLTTLAPRYEAEQHSAYLERLEEALQDPRTRNIALTGRYGVGKSSVLDKFEANHGAAVQRISILTLAPEEPGDSTTNRIQKEIVKQLLYGARHKVGRNSRFSRIAVLSKSRAVVEAAGITALLAGALYSFGWLPEPTWADTDSQALLVMGWTGLAVALVTVLTILRVATHGWFVSDVSAGGATVTLKETPTTFFDKYLDEIVHYFDHESKDIVIFEDLDRFEDPGIFEAVRELNVLLNDTPKRRARRRGSALGRSFGWLLRKVPGNFTGQIETRLPAAWSARLLGRGAPLVFVYAVKDSLFEQLGSDTKELAEAGEAAAAETLRANRTKFFDLVIPIVPFISHRNARELLTELLRYYKIDGIDPRLVALVAQHTTDMRLLRNMCNEYLLFAERLLEASSTAPGLEATKLFALVAYKNFHLSDFENITRRDSDLDRLYNAHQDLVRDAIASNQQRVRDLQDGRRVVRTRGKLVDRLGDRLQRILEAEHAKQRGTDRFLGAMPLVVVAGQPRLRGTFKEADLWAAIANAGSISLAGSSDPHGANPKIFVTWERADLEVMLPEALDARVWPEQDEQATEREIERLTVDVDRLRSADFAQLADMPHYKLARPVGPSPCAGDGADPGDMEPQSFAQIVATTVKSQLAIDLILRGFIDRNFSLYAAQFYGHFTGPDVANFIVHHVQPNSANVDFDLSREGAVANLLDEVEDSGGNLLDSAAIYNVDIANHLLATDHQGATVLVTRIAAGRDEDIPAFLSTFFTAGEQRGALAAGLSANGWTEVFAHLVDSQDVPADNKPLLLSEAMAHAIDANYSFPDTFSDYVRATYSRMPVFTAAAERSKVATALSVLEKVGVLVPALRAVHADHLAEFVERSLYDVTADNLRAAAGDPDNISLETLADAPAVYQYSLRNPGEYLSAVRQDDSTRHVVTEVPTLLRALKFIEECWSSDELDNHLSDLLGLVDVSARIPNLREAPAVLWPDLAQAHLFAASFENFEAYRVERGDIDEHLAGLLEAAGEFSSANEKDFDASDAAVDILNAHELFSSASVRVRLVESLQLEALLEVEQLEPEASTLLAELLRADLVADEPATFERYKEAGWSAIGPAIKASEGFVAFVADHPELLRGMVSEALDDSDVAARVGQIIGSNVDGFVPEQDRGALRAVGMYADSTRTSLRPETVVRIASAGGLDDPILLRLLSRCSPTPRSEHIISTFTSLGGDYAKVTQPGVVFDLRRNETHTALLSTLQDSGHVSFRKRNAREVYKITVL